MEILTCSFSEMQSFLESLETNTPETAYKLEITEIPENFVKPFRYFFKLEMMYILICHQQHCQMFLQ